MARLPAILDPDECRERLLEMSLDTLKRLLAGGHVIKADQDLPPDLVLVGAAFENHFVDEQANPFIVYRVIASSFMPVPDGEEVPRIRLRAEPVVAPQPRGYEFL